MKMELRQLEYFLEVCEVLHFTRASENLNITQPTLSQQIRVLEGEVGTPLFDRIGKKIFVTEAGELLREYSQRILQEHDNALKAIADLKDMKRGHFTVGVLPGDLDYRMNNLIHEFYQTYPNVKLKFIASANIVDLVLENVIDIGITLIPLVDKRVDVIPLYDEEYVFVVRDEEKWINYDKIPFIELKNLKIITFPKGYIGREVIDEYCHSFDFELDPVIETTTLPSVLNLVSKNIGGAILPKNQIKSFYNYKDFKFIDIINPKPKRSMGIINRSDKYLSNIAKAFIKKLKDKDTGF